MGACTTASQRLAAGAYPVELSQRRRFLAIPDGPNLRRRTSPRYEDWHSGHFIRQDETLAMHRAGRRYGRPSVDCRAWLA